MTSTEAAAVELRVPVEEVPDPPPGILGALHDRLNPILIKEVRQALRGRYFRAAFWFTLLTATAVGILVLVVSRMNSFPPGPPFFMAIAACLAVAVHLLVPFYAFISMGSEWDENTYDLLVISNMRPRQLVLGKLLSVSVQAMLFYSAFVPFLVFAFLLRDVDLRAIAVVFGLSLFLSILQSVLALMLSSLTRNRFARVIMMVMMVVVLVFCAGPILMTFAQLVFQPQVLNDPDFYVALAGMLTIGLFLGLFFFAVTCVRLAHPEENRSTGLRVLLATALAVGAGWTAYAYSQFADEETLLIPVMVGLFVLLVPSMFFATEQEELGRRVRPRVPRSRTLALLSAPFLPGGGRGVLLHAVLVAFLLVVPFGIFALFGTRWSGRYWDGMAGCLVAAMYGIIYVGLPSGILSRLSGRLSGRVFTRLVVLCLPILAMLLPALGGFFIEDHDLMSMRHAGFPGYTMDQVLDGDIRDVRFEVALLVILTLVTFVINAPRVFRGMREVSHANTDRLLREAERAGEGEGAAAEA